MQTQILPAVGSGQLQAPQMPQRPLDHRVKYDPEQIPVRPAYAKLII